MLWKNRKKCRRRCQEKLDDAKIQEFSLEVISLAKSWREVCKTFSDDDDSKGVFVKLHHLEHHVRPFMIKHGFYGRGSEEGFEQAHNEFDSDAKIVSRMPCPVNRVNAFVRGAWWGWGWGIQANKRTLKT